jgi:hypothetical protein
MHVSAEYSIEIRFFCSRTVRDLISLRTGDGAEKEMILLYLKLES